MKTDSMIIICIFLCCFIQNNDSAECYSSAFEKANSNYTNIQNNCCQESTIWQTITTWGVCSYMNKHSDGNEPEVCKSCDCCDTNTNCLSENDYVIKQGRDGIHSVLLKDIVIGDLIFDGIVFTKVLTVEYGPKQNMFKFYLSNKENKSNNTTVTMTSNHLLYDVKNELIAANNIFIGDVIFDNYIVNDIKTEKNYASTPYTYSGYLQVNGIKVSSYVHSKILAELTHDWLAFPRWFSSKVSEQIIGKLLPYITYEKYYLKWKNIFGEENMENKFVFNITAGLTTLFIVVQYFISFKVLLVGISTVMSIFAVKRLMNTN